jgi:hypothetical protein
MAIITFFTSDAAGAEGAAVTEKYLLTIKQSGNVGISTNAPSAKLEVNGTSHLRELISTSGDAIELNSLGSGDRNSFIDFHSQDGVDNSARIIREPGANGPFNFQNESSLMSLNTTGNVGIGTTSPTEKLDVAGNINQRGTAGNPGSIQHLAGQSSPFSGKTVFDTDNTGWKYAIAKRAIVWNDGLTSEAVVNPEFNTVAAASICPLAAMGVLM